MRIGGAAPRPPPLPRAPAPGALRPPRRGAARGLRRPPARPQRLLRGSRAAVSVPAGEGVCRARELQGPRPAPGRACSSGAGRGDPLRGVKVGRSVGLQQQSPLPRRLRRTQIYRHEIFFFFFSFCPSHLLQEGKWYRNLRVLTAKDVCFKIAACVFAALRCGVRVTAAVWARLDAKRAVSVAWRSERWSH